MLLATVEAPTVADGTHELLSIRHREPRGRAWIRGHTECKFHSEYGLYSLRYFGGSTILNIVAHVRLPVSHQRRRVRQPAASCL